ncbi:hypothetical protein BDV96DRAFT_587926 [Lophiotrema nucula]|uniref:Uncharacterized protein n=1 Tax=Lophiotrema nucula TaxID=690887 RepID=A0A6A5YPV4_9PLEO|nr:hypothetical protein BDV96DRAFT_587926 [Lophiotrema nucula]
MLYSAWLPEPRYEESIEAEFKNYADWKFWLDPNRTAEVSWDEAATGEHDYLFATWDRE